MKNPVISAAVIAIVVGVLAFMAGVKYQESKRPSFNGQFLGRQGGRQVTGPGGNRSGFRPVVGEIIASDDTSVTVKTQDGSTKIIILSAATEINKAAKGDKGDLSSGSRVMVVGTENSDGSVTAQSIQLNPMMRVFGSSGPSGVR
jgi:hypothetical protein